MSDIVERLANAIEDGACWPGWALEARDEIERLRAALAEAVKAASDYARQAGEWQGKYEASETAAILAGWKERAERAEARVAELEKALKPFADDYVGREGYQDNWAIGGSKIINGDLRRARAALERKP